VPTLEEERAAQAALAPHMVEHEHGNHSLCDPDECFSAKLAYWRTNGMNVSIPSDWKGPSIRVREQRVVEEAKSNGYDPVPIDDSRRWI
jgi:hypothetical protein